MISRHQILLNSPLNMSQFCQERYFCMEHYHLRFRVQKYLSVYLIHPGGIRTEVQIVIDAPNNQKVEHRSLSGVACKTCLKIYSMHR